MATASRLSVRPSVTLMSRDQIDWNTSDIISPSVSLACSLFADTNTVDLLRGEHPKFWPEYGRGIEKVAFGVQKL